MRHLSILFLLFVFSCKLDADKKIDPDKFTFKIGTDTQLFFKNMRESYYDYDPNSPEGRKVYRFSKSVHADSLPLLNLAIVINYLDDEAYLLVEPSAKMGELPFVLISKTDSTNVSEKIRLEEMNRESMLRFSADIYENLLEGQQFYLESNSTTIPVLRNPKEREAFRITVSDYFRLTRVY